MFSKRIVFDSGNLEKYSETVGYGLVDVSEIQKMSSTDSGAALKCGGWNVRRLVEIAHPDRDVVVYRIDVPEFGTYRVDVRIDGPASNVALFAGRRNLIDYGISIGTGEEYHRTFYQAVTPYIPALCSERCNDKCIFISLAGMSAGDLQISL